MDLFIVWSRLAQRVIKKALTQEIQYPESHEVKKQRSQDEWPQKVDEEQEDYEFRAYCLEMDSVFAHNMTLCRDYILEYSNYDKHDETLGNLHSESKEAAKRWSQEKWLLQSDDSEDIDKYEKEENDEDREYRAEMDKFMTRELEIIRAEHLVYDECA
ncbi:hypothetical protein CRE_04274 [Caenorhabditis remanei]|uniref:Uncharacterized protein n=1 Tax=Caenorhabditis remanei TaxID=31234 RepID=E3NAS2_CAERE|nr:hypothetical protein CRE_04274 [Caenorhabditis remanei]